MFTSHNNIEFTIWEVMRALMFRYQSDVSCWLDWSEIPTALVSGCGYKDNNYQDYKEQLFPISTLTCASNTLKMSKHENSVNSLRSKTDSVTDKRKSKTQQCFQHNRERKQSSTPNQRNTKAMTLSLVPYRLLGLEFVQLAPGFLQLVLESLLLDPQGAGLAKSGVFVSRCSDMRERETVERV